MLGRRILIFLLPIIIIANYFSDNALLIQSRYILMEMPLIAFGLMSLIFAMKATKQDNFMHSQIFVFLSAFFGTLSLR